MVGLLRNFLNLVLIPLSFLPDVFQLFFLFLVGFFATFVVGKVIRWLWDLLPIA